MFITFVFTFTAVLILLLQLLSYEGDFSHGEMEGMGTFTWPTGIIFTGLWKVSRIWAIDVLSLFVHH
jgi:hypothetical protein